MEGILLGFAALMGCLALYLIGFLVLGGVLAGIQSVVATLGTGMSLLVAIAVLIGLGALIYRTVGYNRMHSTFRLLLGNDIDSWMAKKALAIGVIILSLIIVGFLAPGSASLFGRDFKAFFFIIAAFHAVSFAVIASDGFSYTPSKLPWQFPWIRFAIAMTGAVLPLLSHAYDYTAVLSLIFGFIIIMA